MSTQADANDISALAGFLAGLNRLTRDTGVRIDHYERVVLALPGGGQVKIADRKTPGGDVEYVVEEWEL